MSRLFAAPELRDGGWRFLGDMVLNLWDCGGQDAFYETYFSVQRGLIFRNVEVLIYVFDAETKTDELDRDLAHYRGVLEAIEANAPDTRVFVLIHKMDLISEAKREEVVEIRQNMISAANAERGIDCIFFQTSIWDETLYKAWSAIVYSLIPNVAVLEHQLANFCNICGADEVVLFERATFLVISHATETEHADIHRFEKISNIIKQFKLSVMKTRYEFKGMMVRNSKFTAFISDFAPNTCIMVITSSPDVQQATTERNIRAAKKHFEKLLPNRGRLDFYPNPSSHV